MRLSDVKGDRSFDVIAELVDPVWSIADAIAASDELSAEFNLVKDKDGNIDEAALKRDMLKRVRKGLPSLIKTNKHDIIAIMATIADKTPEELTKEMSLMSLIKDAYELVTDEVFYDFLSQTIMQREAEEDATQTASTFALVSTEAQND